MNWSYFLTVDELVAAAAFVGFSYLIFSGSLRKRIVWCYLLLSGIWYVVAGGIIQDKVKPIEGVILSYVVIYVVLIFINMFIVHVMGMNIVKRATFSDIAACAICSPVVIFGPIILYLMIVM